MQQPWQLQALYWFGAENMHFATYELLYFRVQNLLIKTNLFSQHKRQNDVSILAVYFRLVKEGAENV